jgi:hypothetical protein
MLKRAVPKSHRIFHLQPSGRGDGSARVVEVESTRARVVQARVDRVRKRTPATVRAT